MENKDILEILCVPQSATLPIPHEYGRQTNTPQKGLLPSSQNV